MTMMMMMMILRVLRMRVRGTTSPKWSRGVGVVDPCTGGGGPYSDNAALIYGAVVVVSRSLCCLMATRPRTGVAPDGKRGD